jgi:hypothetical protein
MKEKKYMANLNPDKWRQDSSYTKSKTYILNSIEFEGKLTSDENNYPILVFHFLI